MTYTGMQEKRNRICNLLLRFLRSIFITTLSISLQSIGNEAFVPIRVSLHGGLNIFSLKSALDQQETGWSFRGHYVYTEVKTPKEVATADQSKPSVLLVHGFGCSTTYWRATAATLVEEGYQVHSVDLLGQGKSAKPGRANGIEYSIALWADLVESYAHENMEGDVVLAGNSLGSLVALSAATGDFVTDNAGSFLKDRVKGICMFNCGVGLNSRGIANIPQWNPLQRQLINSLYDLLTVLIFNNRALLGYILDNIVTPELLRDTLQSLYKCNPARVDDELVQSFYIPAKEDGSVEALSQIYCNEPGATPLDLHNSYADYLNRLPIHLIWGDDDAVTPIEGAVGEFYLSLADDKTNNVSFQIVQSGHVPFDDNPTESNGSLLKWLKNVVA